MICLKKLDRVLQSCEIDRVYHNVVILSGLGCVYTIITLIDTHARHRFPSQNGGQVYEMFICNFNTFIIYTKTN